MQNKNKVDSEQAKEIASTVAEKLGEDKDLGNIFKENEMPLAAWLLYQTEETHKAAQEKFIPIPRIKVTDSGVEEYVFVDFDLELSDFTHVPIKNELLVQNLEDMQDKQRIKGEAIDSRDTIRKRSFLSSCVKSRKSITKSVLRSYSNLLHSCAITMRMFTVRTACETSL